MAKGTGGHQRSCPSMGNGCVWGGAGSPLQVFLEMSGNINKLLELCRIMAKIVSLAFGFTLLPHFPFYLVVLCKQWPVER